MAVQPSPPAADQGMPERYRVLAAVAIGYISIMLAVSPISISLPTMARSLGIDVAEASWIAIAYLLVLTACLLPAGRLGDLIGFKPVFLVGLVLASIASTLAGFMQDLWPIVILRGIQGIGAALLSGTTLAYLTAAFPAQERGRVIGFATVAAALGAGLGSLLTPSVIDWVGWRGVFWLVTPIGLVSLVLAIGIPEPPRAVRERRSIDVLGGVLLAAALFVLSLSFNHLHEGEETFQAGWPFHTASQIGAVALFAAFVWVERRAREPLVRLEYLRHRSFSAAVVANGVFHMTMMATIFLTPFLFERAWGLTPWHSGMVVAVLQALNVSAAFVGGWVWDRTRWRYLPALSLAGIATGMLLLGLLGSVLTFEVYLLVTALLGISSGFFNTSNNTVIMSLLPEEARGFSSGMLETTRQFGHTIAVSLSAVAIGLAGASLTENNRPEAMLVGFQLAEVIMGGIALVGVTFAALGRIPARWAGPPRPAVAVPGISPAAAAPAP
jgi:MFS transporter, DHA2 family, methylenomycin A resistance protein